jgi:hypothetical protein
MSLNFNSQGFLHQTIPLSWEEINHHFGTNPRRVQQLENALRFFRIFRALKRRSGGQPEGIRKIKLKRPTYL